MSGEGESREEEEKKRTCSGFEGNDVAKGYALVSSTYQFSIHSRHEDFSFMISQFSKRQTERNCTRIGRCYKYLHVNISALFGVRRSWLCGRRGKLDWLWQESIRISTIVSVDKHCSHYWITFSLFESIHRSDHWFHRYVTIILLLWLDSVELWSQIKVNNCSFRLFVCYQQNRSHTPIGSFPSFTSPAVALFYLLLFIWSIRPSSRIGLRCLGWHDSDPSNPDLYSQLHVVRNGNLTGYCGILFWSIHNGCQRLSSRARFRSGRREDEELFAKVYHVTVRFRVVAPNRCVGD